MALYDESRTSQIYGGTISLISLATILVIARLYARKSSAANLWWDDFVIVVALVSGDQSASVFASLRTDPAYKVFDWGLSACYWMQIGFGGLGRHTTAAGGPTGPDQSVIFFKATQTIMSQLSAHLTRS